MQALAGTLETLSTPFDVCPVPLSASPPHPSSQIYILYIQIFQSYFLSEARSHASLRAAGAGIFKGPVGPQKF